MGCGQGTGGAGQAGREVRGLGVAVMCANVTRLGRKTTPLAECGHAGCGHHAWPRAHIEGVCLTGLVRVGESEQGRQGEGHGRLAGRQRGAGIAHVRTSA